MSSGATTTTTAISTARLPPSRWTSKSRADSNNLQPFRRTQPAARSAAPEATVVPADDSSPPPPALYDTSVSSGTEGSSGMVRHHHPPYHRSSSTPIVLAPPESSWAPGASSAAQQRSVGARSRVNSQSQQYQQYQQQAAAAAANGTATSRITANNSNNNRVTQSEPGGAVSPDRFAAFMNRFAGELGNDDDGGGDNDNDNAAAARNNGKSSSLTAKAFSAASRSNSNSNSNSRKGATVATTFSSVTTRGSSDHAEPKLMWTTNSSSSSSSNNWKNHPVVGGGTFSARRAQSEVMLGSSSTTYNSSSNNNVTTTTTSATGRTRDLALRLEQRKRRQQQQKQQQQQQQPSATAAAAAAATQRVVPQQQQQQQEARKEDGQQSKEETERRKGSKGQRLQTSQNGAASGDRHHHSNTIQHFQSPEEAISSSQRRSRDHTPNVAPHAHTKNTVLSDSRSSSRGEEEEETTSSARRQRPKSLPPELRRRHRPLQPPPPLPDAPGSKEDDEEDARNTSVIIQHGPRAEIETPQPAKVRELRRKLWTEEEYLIARGHPVESYGDYDFYGDGARRNAAAVARRNARSLSPKSHRRLGTNNNNNNNDNNNTSSVLFKSRYYDAAHRGSERTTMTMTTTKTTPTSPASRSSSRTPLEEKERLRALRNEHLDDLAKSSSMEKLSSSTTTEPKTVLSLLSKLSLVNRDDPKAALAQIDAILNQESESLSGGGGGAAADLSRTKSKDSNTLPSVRQARPLQSSQDDDDDGDDESDPEGNKDNEDDDSSSDETSVSSITNPTYASLRNKSDKVTETSAMNSGGRPRPSSLQQYGQTASKTASDRAKKKELLEQNPPPTAIHVSKGGGGGGAGGNKLTAAAAAAAGVEPKKDSVIDDDPAMDDVGATLFQKIGAYMAPKPGTGGEAKLSHSAEIEEKIKRWDDMSTGVISAVEEANSDPNTGKTEKMNAGSEKNSEEMFSTSTAALGSIITDEEQQQRDVSTGTALRRAHPWDATIPVRMGNVATQETSMDLGDGVETQYVAKYPNATLSPDRSGISPVRRMRKDRIAGRENPAEDARFEKSRGDDLMEQLEEGPEDEISPPVHLSNSRSSTEDDAIPTLRQEAANTMAEEFDSAWVNLPPSSFFKGGRASQQSRNGRRTREEYSPPTKEMPASTESSPDRGKYHISDGEVEVEYVPERPAEFQTFSPKVDSGSIERAGVSTFVQLGGVGRNGMSLPSVPSEESGSLDESLARSAKKSKRGLRAFLKRKQKQPADKLQVPAATDQATYTSTGSRRFRESRPPLRESMDDSADGEAATAGKLSFQEKRRSARSRSPSKTRSKSLDERRIRNPNIARKFSRLLRVYDDDVE